MRSSEINFFNPANQVHGVMPFRFLYVDEYNEVFLPVTRRSRGSAWGNGNRTLGGYKRMGMYSHAAEASTTGRWYFEWVDPRSIRQTLQEYLTLKEQQKVAAAERKAAQAAKVQETKARFAETGLTFGQVMRIFGMEQGAYARTAIAQGRAGSLYVTADRLLALIAAAQEAAPVADRKRAAKVQAEVDAALAMLGEVR